MPLTSLPFLHQYPHRITSLRANIWQVLKVYFLSFSINKVVGEIDKFFAETLKELGNCCEEIQEQKDMRVK
jgi:hypothetical protein